MKNFTKIIKRCNVKIYYENFFFHVTSYVFKKIDEKNNNLRILMNESLIKIDKFQKNLNDFEKFQHQFWIIFIRREFIVILLILTIKFKYFIFLTKKSHFFNLHTVQIFEIVAKRYVRKLRIFCFSKKSEYHLNKRHKKCLLFQLMFY